VRAIVFALFLSACALAHAAGDSVQLEALTWTELRDRVAAGATIALLPIGGTEQNGPHMALGKHNVRARLLGERIAMKLGNAIVAPVLAYVPEGSIEPPTEHMRWPGTISVPVPAFEAVIEATARSLLRAGFTDIVLLGDSGNYRASLDRVAARVRGVHALPEYYRAATEGFAQILRARGFSAEEIGRHAAVADTSLLLALDASLVRARAAAAAGDGVGGDPRRAAADVGQLGVDHIVEQSVAAIRARAGKRQSPPR
jgi:creatinine amidohydrolase